MSRRIFELYEAFMTALTHSAPEYFEKLAFKKNKTCNFKRLYLNSEGESRAETNIFRKFIQFSLKQRCCFFYPAKNKNDFFKGKL